MKAIQVTNYGGPEVLKVKEIPTPIIHPGDVLIKVHTAAVNNTDPVFRKGQPFISRLFTGLVRPKYPTPGDILAGDVVEVGSQVTKYKIGDRVCGYATDALGAQAEFISLSQDAGITHIPPEVSYEEAACIVDGGHTSLYFLEDIAKLKSGQKVLINGASGSMGTAAVQLAVGLGAEVTGVCSSSNVALVQSLGAHQVIDYTKDDFTCHTGTYDVIFDTVAKSAFSKCKGALSSEGIYMTTFPTPAVMIKGLFQSKNKGKRAFSVPPAHSLPL